MHSDNIAISVRNLGKTYRVFTHPGDRIKQAFTFGRMRFHKNFTALEGLSFDIRKGETVGIIGRNGSGKSTLLQLICGILKPTTGTVTVTGRVAALLELGTGFHPEFTGRENVYFQGAVIGLTQNQIDDRFAEIAEFADIGEFMDQPVRTYSSGMYVRLAFSLAVHTDPDVLIVDEALAVGDARFQSKCFRRFEQLKDKGATLVVVSHATELITRLCGTVVLLDGGKTVTIDAAEKAVNRYLDLLFGVSARENQSPAPLGDKNNNLAGSTLRGNQEHFNSRPAYNSDEYRWGNRRATIVDFNLRAGGSDHSSHIKCSITSIDVIVTIVFSMDVRKPVFGLMVKSREGHLLFGVNTLKHTDLSGPRHSNERIVVRFSLIHHLGPGDYFISVGVSEDSGGDIIPLDRRYDAIHLQIVGGKEKQGFIDMASTITIADTLPRRNNGANEATE